MEEENKKIRRRDWRPGYFSGGEILKGSNVKIKESRLDLFYFSFHFYFIFDIFFYFLFLEQLGLGLIGHAVISVTTWWYSYKTDHETWEKEVEGFKIEWRHTTWTPHVGLMFYTWSFRIGCTVVSMDHW